MSDVIRVNEIKNEKEILEKVEYMYVVKAISFKKIESKEEWLERAEKKALISGVEIKDENVRKNYDKMYGELCAEYSDFDSSYHLLYEEAREMVIKNIGDINEAGCYNYAAICKIPLGCSYFNTNQNPKEDFEIFKWEGDSSGRYHLIDEKAEEYEFILYKIWGMYFDNERIPWNWDK